MKCARSAFALLALGLLVGAPSGLAAAPAPVPSSLSVILDDAYPPYAFRDARGALRGILVDRWKLWEKKTGVAVTLVGTDWDKAVWLMDHGGADVIDSVFYTPERARRYDFARPYAQIQVPVFFPRDIGSITDTRSLQGFVVGVKSGDAAADFLRRAGVSTLREFTSYEAVIRAVADKRIRIFCMDMPPALYYLSRFNLEGEYRRTAPLYVGELGWAVRKGNLALKTFVEQGFSRITPAERLQIQYRWKGTPLQRLIYYHYGAYAGYVVLGGAALFLGLLFLAWWLGRRVVRGTIELRRAMEELGRSEARFRLLAENADDVIWTMDLDGRFTYVSPSVEKLRGFTPEEVMRQRLEEVVAPESLATVKGLLAELSRLIRAGNRTFDLPPTEVIQPCKDGTTVWTEVILTPLFDNAGSFLALLGITRDISERRRREEEQRALEAQMLQAQKLESLGVLAGGIAHDFNNILTSILGNAELAQGELPPGSAVRDRIRDIDEASRRAADLCQQMLAYSGRGRVAVEPVDLSGLVSGMIHMLKVSISKKAVLHADLPEGLPRVTADATQLRQIVMNLIINASEALGTATGDISVATGIRDCTAAFLAGCFPGDPLPDGPYAYIQVADTGIGMDEATIPRIFDPFFSTKFAGRGLGLAAVLGIVRAHKGAIRVTSAPGKGTTFRVYLPVAARGAGTAPSVSAAPPDWKGEGTILLVDDEETVRTVGKLLLENLGFSVITAGDGVEALRVFRDRREEIAGIVLDLTMPRMDGTEAYRELLRIDPGARIAISTGYSEQEAAGRFKGDGPSVFILKPYRRAELTEALQSLMAKPGG